MKRITTIAAIAFMALAGSAYAQLADRSEATLDTGKGGFSVKISVPKSDGPTDFAGNPGPRISTDNGNTYGEMVFRANAGDTAVALYEVAVFRDDRANERKKPMTAEVLAKEMIKTLGFTGRAVKSECPEPPFAGVTMACYKMSGFPDLSFDPKNWGFGISLVAYSFRNNTQGFVFIGNAVEKDKAKYKADPTFVEKKAESKLNSLVKYSTYDLH